eukprot:1857315-Ditylum_brightwellii.AAC.1
MHPSHIRRRKKIKLITFVAILLKVRTEELKDHVFDTGPKLKNQFAAMTRAIGEYMMRTSKNAGEFISAFNPDNLGFSRI